MVWPCEIEAQRPGRTLQDPASLKEASSPSKIFSKIEISWRNSDARYLADLVGSGKAYIVLGEKGPRGGYYSKSQVFYLMKRMFGEYSQLKFEFVKYHNINDRSKKVFAVASRSYKNIRSDKVFQDKVYITLGKEGDDWVLTEIKTTR